MNESNGLNENFKSRIGKLHERYIDLINCEPISRKQIKINVPLRGMYLFIENGQAIYVGRCDRMGARLMEHGRSSSGHNDASFAFKLARFEAEKVGINVKRKRTELCDCVDFRPFFINAKERVADMQIKYVAIEDAVDQYLFELYIALELETIYNDFENH